MEETLRFQPGCCIIFTFTGFYSKFMNVNKEFMVDGAVAAARNGTAVLRNLPDVGSQVLG